MKFLQNFFGRRPPGAPELRSTKNSDDLTEFELKALEASRCPDCTAEELRAGPEGCGSINILCARCGSEFCHGGFHGTRISDPGKGRWEVYGLKAPPQRVIAMAPALGAPFGNPPVVGDVTHREEFKTAVLELLGAIDLAAMDRSALVGNSPYVEHMVVKARVVRARISKV